MGLGVSKSTSTSEQSAQAFLTQQSSGSCDISCQNVQSGINIDIINSMIGGDINLTASCSVDANCLMNNSSDASSDILFKAMNSSNAKNAGPLVGVDVDISSSSSRQDIKQSITQTTTQSCKLSSVNQFTNINILAANSTIGGSINISQTGSTKGSCTLNNNMSASASATAMASNTAQSGKDKKGSTGVLYYIFGFIGIMIVVFIMSKMFTSGRDASIKSAKMDEIAQLYGKAGCPNGGEPFKDSNGKYIINPTTNRPICPVGDIQKNSIATTKSK